MAVSVKVHRVANPHRRRRRAMPARGRGGRFVKVRTKRTKRPAVKRRRRNTARVKVRRNRRVNSRRTRHVRRRVRKVVNRRRRRTRRVSNPVLVELGMLNPRRNPRKRRNSTVARRKKANRRRRTHHRRHRRNPVAVVTRRRHNRRHHASRRRYSRRYRRNPMGVSTNEMLVYGVGGLIGVAATKFLPTLIPASMMASIPSSPIISVGITLAGAFAASFIAGKIAPAWSKGVLYGGLMQTASAALNAFAPASVRGALALSGVGDIIPTNPFPVPNNQMRPMLVAAPAAGVSGVGAGIRRRRSM